MLFRTEGLSFFSRTKPGKQAKETLRSTAHPLSILTKAAYCTETNGPRAFIRRFQSRGRGDGGQKECRSHWLGTAAPGAGGTSGDSIIDGPVMNICSSLNLFCMTCFKWFRG